MSSPRTPRATRAQLNERSATQLELLLPGVGSVFAARIVEHRERHGPFRTAADLARVRGLGERRAARVWEGLEPEAEEEEESGFEAAPRRPAPAPPAPAPPAPAPPAPPPAPAPPATPSQRDGAVFASSFPSRLDEGPPSSPPRSFGRLALGGAMAMAVGLACTWVAERAWTERPSRPEVDVTAVTNELAALREGLTTLRAEQADAADERSDVAERLAALEEHSSADGAAIAALDERSTAIEVQAKKSERALVSRLVKAEDELLWHRLVWAAQHTAWKEKRAEEQAKAPPIGDDVEE